MPKILLVEEDDVGGDGGAAATAGEGVLSRGLRGSGYEVLSAHDGEGMVTMAGSESPDLILMDLNLPVLDGWSVMRQLKRRSATRDLPVIALTGHEGGDSPGATVEAACDDFETTPVDLPRL